MCAAILGYGAAMKKRGANELTFVREDNLKEFYEIVGTPEEYPINNNHGSEIFRSECESSKTITVEFSVEKLSEVNAKLSPAFLESISGKLSAKMKTEVRKKIGESVTRKQTIKLAVKAEDAVKYTITWKRRIRTASQFFKVRQEEVRLDYRLEYDVVYEIATEKI